MNEFIAVKHSFNAGDLIVILPGLRQLYRDTGKKVKIYQRLGLDAFYYHNQINSTFNSEGNSVCFNERLFKMMKPLIEAQEYIESFEVWEGQEVQLDYDLSRDSKSIPMPAGLIHTYSEAVFPQTATDLSETWLKVDEPIKDYKNTVIINRTQRYTNPYITFYFLKEYETSIVFSGTNKEHEEFCKAWNLDLVLVYDYDFKHLAQIIASCKFGVYNQSLNWHIADALKTPRILEICQQFPNTFSTGKNGYHIFGQAAMEFQFRKLINQ